MASHHPTTPRSTRPRDSNNEQCDATCANGGRYHYSQDPIYSTACVAVKVDSETATASYT
ncbi:TPA: hypothetical protein N0F65_012041 [Lagenidium giganteum]|uniref:Uncharacterized protein n=1 Tax=Lagenidium giganteum TaxID=4803 RepID=A0AAV2YUH0_9STRA|nr:TPA: hypothetical protein N0F65_012041 [Lagenidium giganteum]